MAQRGLTELLNAHHDKLNQHTLELEKIQAQLTALDASVSKLNDKLAETEADESSGALRTWLKQIRELL